MQHYLVAVDWSHIFDDRRGEEFVRFAYDCAAGRLVAIDHRHSENRAWAPATAAQAADVLESLVQNYSLAPEGFGTGGQDDPAEFGMELVHEIPDWAAGRSRSA